MRTLRGICVVYFFDMNGLFLLVNKNFFFTDLKQRHTICRQVKKSMHDNLRHSTDMVIHFFFYKGK